MEFGIMLLSIVTFANSLTQPQHDIRLYIDFNSTFSWMESMVSEHKNQNKGTFPI